MLDQPKDSNIVLDYSNVLVDNIGSEHGLDKSIFENEDQLNEIHNKLILQRKNERMAFLDLPFNEKIVPDIQTYVDNNRDRFDYYVHLGIGGSALGPIALHSALRHQYYNLLDWFCQIWAESLGKRKNLNGEIVEIGPLPVKALGATDQHSQVQLYMEGPNDKVYIFMEVGNHESTVQLNSPFSDSKDTEYLNKKSMNQLIHAEKNATELALTENYRPNMTFKLHSVNPFVVGQILQCLEIATVVAGELFQIDPFDQPGVEAGKIATYALMGKPWLRKKKTGYIKN